MLCFFKYSDSFKRNVMLSLAALAAGIVMGTGVEPVVQAVTDDAYEENDRLNKAYPIPADVKLSDLQGPGVQLDEDWYRIDVSSDSFRRVKVECLFSHNGGDIDVYLCASDGTVLDYAISATDNEYMDFEVPLPGSYYICVYSSGGVETGNTYDLVWKALPTGEDLYEPNNTLSTAFTGLPEGIWLSSLEGPGLQRDDDWYRISVTDSARRRVVVDCTFIHSEGDIDIVLYDADGTQLVYPWTTTDNEQIDFVVPSTGYYYVKVCFANAGNAYDLRWITLDYAPPSLSYLSINGPSSVNENSSGNYFCIAHYSDGSTQDVTPAATWGENSPYATISAVGVLTAGEVQSDQSVSVSAAYGGRNAARTVLIVDIPPVLISLSIQGADYVDANIEYPYTCTAHYSNGSTADVTDQAGWSEDSPFTSISSVGLLTETEGNMYETVTVTATYGGLDATKVITVNSSLTELSYEEWLFLQEVPETLTAHDDIPADDGIPNLLKYACGLSALDFCTTSDLMTVVPEPSAGTFSIIYHVSKSAVDAVVEPLCASSVNGPWFPVEIRQKIGEDGDIEHWKATMPMDGCGFMRLRAVPADGGIM